MINYIFAGMFSIFAGLPFLVLLLIGIISFLLYFLPAYIGRNKENSFAILLVNLFLGWSLIVWVICLIWAITAQRRY